jgi:hypothetical protein
MEPSELSPLSLPLLLEALDMFNPAIPPSKPDLFDWGRIDKVEFWRELGGDGFILIECVLDTDARRPKVGGGGSD